MIEKLKAIIRELEETPVYTSKPRRMLQEILDSLIAEAEQKPEKPDIAKIISRIEEAQSVINLSEPEAAVMLAESRKREIFQVKQVLDCHLLRFSLSQIPPKMLRKKI
jgi:hypothetical protein